MTAIPTAQAGNPPTKSWIFRKSYYSHDPVQPVQIGRQRAGGPVFSRPEGDYVQAGFRRVYSSIQVPPYTWDNINIYEAWTHSGSQY